MERSPTRRPGFLQGSERPGYGPRYRALGHERDAALRAWAKELDEEEFKFLSTGFWLRYEDILDREPWREQQEQRHTELARLFWTLEATGHDVDFLRDSLTHAEDYIAGR